jgi:hypothetical protein
MPLSDFARKGRIKILKFTGASGQVEFPFNGIPRAAGARSEEILLLQESGQAGGKELHIFFRKT